MNTVNPNQVSGISSLSGVTPVGSNNSSTAIKQADEAKRPASIDLLELAANTEAQRLTTENNQAQADLTKQQQKDQAMLQALAMRNSNGAAALGALGSLGSMFSGLGGAGGGPKDQPCKDCGEVHPEKEGFGQKPAQQERLRGNNNPNESSQPEESQQALAANYPGGNSFPVESVTEASEVDL